jgi:GGDEF domain-containing protein
MIGSDPAGDPERIIRDLEHQMQHYPLRTLRLTGSRNRLLGLFLLSRNVPLNETALQNALAELSGHLEGPPTTTGTMPPGRDNKISPADGRKACRPEQPPLEQILATEIERTRQTRLPCALILLHIDGAPNTASTTTPEQLQHEITELLRAIVRRSDMLLHCAAAHQAIILPRSSLRETLDCAERIRQAVFRQRPGGEGAAPVLTASIGIGLCHATDRLSADAFAARVTRELERAREQGGNCICQAGSQADFSCQVSVEERAELFSIFAKDRQP